MTVQLISKTTGVGDYEGMSATRMIEAVDRHGKVSEREPGKLLKYLLEHGYYSPLEHVHFGFRIVTSRAISAQFARHKSLHFQEFSQRYSEVPEFELIELRKAHEKNRQSSTEVFNPILYTLDFEDRDVHYYAEDSVERILEDIKVLYSKLLKAGVAKECARMILPMSSQTTIHMTANLRDWLAFLNQRCHEDTQKEAREIAMEIGETLEREMPDIMGDIDWRKGKFM